MRQAHAAYFTALAEQAYPNQFGKDTAGWQQRLAVEQGNLVQALTWTLSEGNDAGLGLRLAGALSRTWRLNGEWRQGCAWLALALAPPTDDAAARARALVGMGSAVMRCRIMGKPNAVCAKGWRSGNKWATTVDCVGAVSTRRAHRIAG
jgi:hypothetical protein